MNPSPRLRFGKGFSSAVLVGVVLACGYTLGKRISSAEAAVGPVGGETTSGPPASANSIPDNGSGQPTSAKSSPDASVGETLPADSELLEFDATAYSLPGNTAAGIATRRGILAADPRILPLGSVVHIRAGDYSGTYLVLDTGAKIKGRKIDIYMPDRREAISFGRRPVRLKVLGHVHPSHLRPKSQS